MIDELLSKIAHYGKDTFSIKLLSDTEGGYFQITARGDSYLTAVVDQRAVVSAYGFFCVKAGRPL